MLLSCQHSSTGILGTTMERLEGGAKYTNDVLLQARVGRMVEGLDLNLYQCGEDGRGARSKSISAISPPQ
ncbi:hypothetical protein FCM35_KLT16650 [Carex littledalei]|uniref:Uncharacterized protein n=1 Tax=Carex littledalei TaxID=544730 RepID=A0A833W0E1_9POAL|nr:hypothetical protein FCM35_KLT16650 [Carex littledalei]